MGKQPEDVKLTVPLPKGVTNASLTPSFGTYTFDTVWPEVWPRANNPTGVR